ncbi:MAG: Asp-tRNA(Asn)/Glu-tRNA(Gln) amidotransferase subunit GatB [Deferribacteraceae bacterium]|jgi:aspartyl-tRNA(Asn)/glutamyl-tRNA(Gln) amidotransferase subunit B|nr:Asp-tRNA(Asn)/Glu-tRNA(Gln) amidotransferase subunit GatB [Deferribacteraceae bacterium]
MQFEPVIGLEVHVQLDTKSKIFCSCSTKFGAEANNHVCPVCMGLPGSMPVLNKEVVNQAIRAGLALGCDIQRVSTFDRKNYFYPDLPTAYQKTQMYHPICIGGTLTIETEKGERRTINLTRIHIEEDAGKLVHGESIGASDSSYVDLNRSSMPLIEIVSNPEMHTAEEARLYMQKLRTILLYAGVSDCNMEEGSMRCDANISIRPVGETKLGTRVEIKNMNSFRNVQRAVEYEIKRQEKVLREGGSLRQETRLWDNDKQITFPMRSKEDAHDYRYFPDPDLLPLVVESDLIESLRKGLPEMPDSRKARFIDQYGLPKQDAELLSSERSYADYYEEALKTLNSPKPVANWIMSEVLRVVNDRACGIYETGITPANLALLVQSVEDGTISGKQGKELFQDMLASGRSPIDIIKEKGLAQVSDTGALEAIVKSVIEANPAEAERFKQGDKKLVGFFVGQIMKASQGKANPKLVNDILMKVLS